MKTQILYSANQVSTAAAKVFNVRRGITTGCALLSTRRDKRGTKVQFTWDNINDVLTAEGWSPRHILSLLNKLI